MKGKGSRLAILLALVLTLVGAFGITAFAADSTSHGAKAVNIQDRSAAGTRDVVECDIDYSGDVMTVDYKAQELMKLPAADGRPDGYAWIGLYVAAPEGYDNPQVSQTKTGGYEALDNDPEEGANFKAHHIWIGVNKGRILTALKESEGIISYTFYYDWNNSGVANDTLNVNIDVNDLVLFEKNGTTKAITTEAGKVVHDHVWKAATSVSDGKRTVKCDVDGCEYHDKGFEVGVSIDDKTYDGEAVEATTFYDEDLPDDIKVTFDTMNYYHGSRDDSDKRLTDGAPSVVNDREGENGVYLARTYAKVDGTTIGTVYKTFKINPVAVEVTANSISKVYGDADARYTPTLTYTVDEKYKSLVEGALATNLKISAKGWWQVGEYDITQGTLASNDPNYALDFTEGQIKVSQATNELTVTLDGWVQGSEPNEPTFEYKNGIRNNIVVEYFNAAKEKISEPTAETPAGQYYIKATMPGTANYTEAVDEKSFMIADTENPFEFEVKGWTFGEDATPIEEFNIICSDGISSDGIVLQDVEFKRKGTKYKTWEPWENAGRTTPARNYVVRATIHDTTGTYADSTYIYNDPGFTVSKRDLTVDITPTSKEFGDADPYQFTFSASEDTPLPTGVDIEDVVANVERYKSGAAGGSTVGDYPFVITLTEGSAINYNVTANPEKFQIVPKELTVKTELNRDSWSYRQNCGDASVVQSDGEDLPDDTGWTISYKYKPADSEDGWEDYPASDGIIPVGTYTLRADIDTTGSSYTVNERGSDPDCEFTVTASRVKVTASDYRDVYKPDNDITSDGVIIDEAEISPQETGEVFDEDEVRSLLIVDYKPAWDSPVGTYPVGLAKDSAATGNENYDIEFVDGEYTITKRPLSIKAVDKDTEYGTVVSYSGLDDLELNGEPGEDEGFAYDEDFDNLDGTVTYSYTGGYGAETSGVGTYKAVPSGLTSGNYRIDLGPGTITVYEKTINLTWTDNEGDLFDYDYDGKTHTIIATTEDILSQDRSAVKLQFSDNVQKDVKRSEETWKVGAYWAKASLTDVPQSANYKIKWNQVKQKFKIHPVDLILIPENNTVVYGNAVVDKSFRGEGFVNDEDVSVVQGTPATFTYGDYEPGKDVATYQIAFADDFNTKDGLYAQNYQLKKSTGTLTVTPRPVSIQWGNTVGLIYNGTDQKPGATIDNRFGDDDVKPVRKYYDSKGKEVTAAVNAGTYTARVTGLYGDKSGNYTLEGGTNLEKPFTIGQATAVVTANNNTIYLNDAPANAGYTVKGLIGKDTVGTVTYTYTYKQYGKPGNYKINPVVSNANPNYKITTNPGTLTVKDNVNTIVAKATASGKTKGKLGWNAVTKAASYDVYFARCNHNGKKYSCKKVATVSGTSYTKKGLKKGTCYKFYVVAKDANGNQISKSLTGHFIAGNDDGNRTNAKSISVKSTNVNLNVGGTSKIKATQKKAKGGRKLLSGGHAALVRYKTSNGNVATVSSNGTIKAVGSGFCRVYVQSVNGLWKTVDVTVN